MLGGVVVLAGLLGAAPVAGLPQEPEPAMPVLGQALVAATSDTEERLEPMVVTVHGLRRVGTATVLYYSVGFAGQAPDPEVAPVTAYGSGPGTYETLQSSPGSRFMDSAAAIDLASRTSYGALRRPDGTAVAAPPPDTPDDRVRLSGRAVVQWIALAPIPDKVKVVDLLVGSAFVRGVPVGKGAMTPASTVPAPAAGTGWPEVDTFALAEGSPQNAVLPLQPRITVLPKPKPKPTPTTPAKPKPSGTPSASPSPSGSRR